MFKLFASCDSVYLNQHAPALAASAACAGNNLHLHVINASPTEVDFLHFLSEKWEKMTAANFTFSWGDMFTSAKDKEQLRTIFACDRFVTVGNRLRYTDDTYLVIDTDCLVMKKIEEPTGQIGLFVRESLEGTQGWESRGTKIAAGAVYYSRDAVEFAEEVAFRIRKGPVLWFLDQVAISETYEKHISNYRFDYFDSQFMDWEFVEGTTIWTGKGPRKYDNSTYLTKKNHFDRMIR